MDVTDPIKYATDTMVFRVCPLKLLLMRDMLMTNTELLHVAIQSGT